MKMKRVTLTINLIILNLAIVMGQVNSQFSIPQNLCGVEGLMVFYDINQHQYKLRYVDESVLEEGDFSMMTRRFGDCQNEIRNYISTNLISIEYSRTNYLNCEALVNGDLEEFFIEISSSFIDNEPFRIDDLEEYDKFLNLLSAAERMDYELKIVKAFIFYAKENYDNEVELMKTYNFLKEDYYDFILITKNGKFYLSSIVFRYLFPDYDRDDFESKEDVRVDLEGVKGLIDYYNSDRFFEISHD